MKIIALVVIIIFIVLFMFFIVLGFESFRQTVLGERRDKKKTYLTLKNMNMLYKNIYNVEEVKIKSNEGYDLIGYFIEKNKNNNRYVILIHGYKWSHYFSMAFADLFLREGFNILAIDSRNHGKSQGKYPSYGYYEKEDINLWIETIKKRGNFEQLFLGLHGQSMGAATALIAGGNSYDVKFVIEDCGFSSAKECMKYTLEKHKYIPSKLLLKLLKIELILFAKFNIDDVNPINEIKKKKDMPVLFVHGKCDKRIPCEMAERMYKQKGGQHDILFLVDDAIHMDSYGKSKMKYEKYVHEIISAAEKMYNK